MDNYNDIEPIINFKTESEELEVEYEILPMCNIASDYNSPNNEINSKIKDIDDEIAKNQEIIDKFNADIDKLTSHADGWDYSVAVCSGILTGLIDSFFVGEFDFTNTKENVDQKFKDIVTKKAKEIEENEKDEKIKSAIEKAKKKAEEKGEKLSDEKINEIKNKINESFNENQDINKKIEIAIEKAKEKGELIDDNKIKEITDKVNNNEFSKLVKKLEDKFGIPSDSVWSNEDGISSKSHHLDDLAHHPTIIGWFASMMTQFTGNAYFSNEDGLNMKIKARTVKVIKKGKEETEIILIGKGIKEKFFCGTINWIGHLISDMAGSNQSAKKGNFGMGIPGPILSTLKELSMCPIIKKTPLPKLLNELFTNDKFRFDFRSELALGIEVGKQAIPVLINEVFVRAFYFIRRLAIELKGNNEISKINWENTIPFNNRTIVRMMTIATSTFTTIDLADAAIRGAVNSGGTPAGFASQFVLRVNFVGVGRCAIACGTDIAMGVKRSNLRNERIAICCEQLYLLNAKTFYKQANMWIAAKDAEEATEEAVYAMNEAIILFNNAFQDINNDLNKIKEYIPLIEEKNPGLIDDINDILIWG